MRTNDQWFQPGDKVMRVVGNGRPGIHCDAGSPQMGQVYCVEAFYEGPKFNAVMLVGFGGWRYVAGNPYPIGWRASFFRKVDEIRLCCKAVARTSQPKKDEVSA